MSAASNRALFGTLSGSVSLTTAREVDTRTVCYICFQAAEIMCGESIPQWSYIGWLMSAMLMNASAGRNPTVGGASHLPLRYLTQNMNVATMVSLDTPDFEVTLLPGFSGVVHLDQDLMQCGPLEAEYRISLIPRATTLVTVRLGPWSSGLARYWTAVQFPDDTPLLAMLGCTS